VHLICLKYIKKQYVSLGFYDYTFTVSVETLSKVSGVVQAQQGAGGPRVQTAQEKASAAKAQMEDMVAALDALSKDVSKVEHYSRTFFVGILFFQVRESAYGGGQAEGEQSLDLNGLCKLLSSQDKHLQLLDRQAASLEMRLGLRPTAQGS
jgi:hypothetical protein